MARLRQDMAASVDERSRPVQVLPAESASSEGRASVLGFSAAAEPCKKKGMGVKEMEAVSPPTLFFPLVTPLFILPYSAS